MDLSQIEFPWEDDLPFLVMKSFDGSLTKKELQELRSRLNSDESARLFFARSAVLQSQLETHFAIPLDVDVYSMTTHSSRTKKRSFYHLLFKKNVLLLSLCALFWCGAILLTYFLFFSSSPPQQIANKNPAGSMIKKIVKKDDQPINHSQQILKEGTVELTLPTGVKVLITAPAIFQITGENSILLSRGMLPAEVTTEAGKGFTVKTPSSINVDLGTIFGITVDQKGTSVTQVFRGIVNSTNNLSIKNSSLPQAVQLTTNERILHRIDGTSTQEIKNLAELFFVNFDHSNLSNKTRVAKLIGIDKITAKNLRQQQEKNHASMANIASLEEEVLLSNKRPQKTNTTIGFYNSFDNELAIEMGGVIKNAKQGPQHANLNYEDGGVLVQEGSRLSFETAGNLSNKKGHISFRIKPNWDGATDKQRRLFFSSGSFQIGKWYGSSGPKSYLVFRLNNGMGIRRETNSFYAEPKVLESWKKGTWHTIEVEWDFTLPLDQKYITLTVDHLFTGTITGSWSSTQSLGSTFTIGTDDNFGSEADAVFDKIYIDNELKGNKK